MENISRIPFPGLIEELQQYANRVCAEDKIHRVYALCVKARKFSLANKIAIKYRILLFKSDMVMAMEMSLWALAKNKL